MKDTRILILASLAGTALLLGGCGKSSVDTATASAPADAAAKAKDAFPGLDADMQRTFKEEPNFYKFKTAADIPADTKGLTWEDSSGQASWADPAAKKGGTLTLAIGDFPGTLRSIGPNSNASFREFLSDYVLEALVRFNPAAPGKLEAELATSWAIDRPNKTVFFKLDPDAKWSDGVPFTTDDIVFSFYLFRTPLLNDPWLNDYFHKTFSSVTVYDAHTFSATLAEVRPDIVARIGDPDAAMPPFPKHFFKDFGPDWVATYNWRIMPTTGAYTIKEEDIKRTTSITLSHVKDWWAEKKPWAIGRYNPDRIRLSVIRDPDKAIEAFFHGDTDLYPSIQTQNWYTKFTDTQPTVASGFTVRSTFYNQIPPPDWGLWINTAKPPLDNLNVRLGIQYATNFALVCQQYFRGDATLQSTDNDGYGWDINPDVRPRPFDPAKAREYFTKAGFSQQGSDGILANAKGDRLTFTITTVYKRYQDVLVILKQEALKAGLEFNIEMLDETTGFQKEEEKRHDIDLGCFNRPVDMYPRYWETDSGDNAYDVPYLPDHSANPARKLKTSTNNLYSLADYDLDQVIKAYDKTETMDQVKELSSKAEKMFYDDAVWVNGWKIPFIRSAYRPWVKWPKDFSPMQTRDVDQFWVMWIDEDEKKADQALFDAGKTLPPQTIVYDKYKQQ
ncbi:MAG TPA: ABC transporter substrate-binding protein [Opitutaceae bacterium]|jgi:microcin C transport system substrate-binding protein|nr:ABC transporter substrate-binding protein [Opitutaceae bacterium]